MWGLRQEYIWKPTHHMFKYLNGIEQANSLLSKIYSILLSSQIYPYDALEAKFEFYISLKVPENLPITFLFFFYLLLSGFSMVVIRNGLQTRVWTHTSRIYNMQIMFLFLLMICLSPWKWQPVRITETSKSWDLCLW